LLAVVLLVVFGTGLFAGWQFNHTAQFTSASGIQQVSVPPLKSTDLQARREEVIARIRPAVVQLNITTNQGSALGSGVIIDKNGYIVTNNHVVSGVSSVNEVVLSDGTTIKNAPVVGVDQQDDLAVIKINPPSNLTVAPLGDSSQLKVGQDVLAIGSPLGNTQTVTSGIISALGRNVSEGTGATLPGTIQTDAPINPGNSGGALVDLNGNLIGIPTLTAVDPEFNAPANGVGFAIPSNRVKFIAEQLITAGNVTHTGRAAIGIKPESVDPNLQAQGNLPVDHGVLIYQLVSGGAAEKAGMKTGDIIVQIDGKAIKSVSDLEDALLTKNPGDKITVTVYRNNQQITLNNVVLGELQANSR
jgi:S1-C subfamily serine protease